MTSKAEISSITGAAVVFDEQLLSYIRCSRNDEAKSIITPDLANAFDAFGSLLHYAATYGNATVAGYLMELGSEINFFGRGRKTPLMLATSGGRTAVMKALLNADADIDIVDDGGQSALQIAFGRDYVNCDIVEPFARKLQTKMRTTKELAERLIAAGGNMYHAVTLGDAKPLKLLLERGVNIDSKGPNGATALHAAAELGQHRVVSWLIQNGAHVNALDNRGNSALHVSASNGSKLVMSVLLEYGADCKLTRRRDGCTPLNVVSKKVKSGVRFVECLKLLRKHGTSTTNVKIPFSFDEELLTTIRFGQRPLRSQLNETLIEARDDLGTLLHHAASYGNATAAELLIELGSKVDAFAAGRTPLMLAVREPNPVPVVEVLLQAGANVELTDEEGRSALSMALEPRCFLWSSVPVASDRTSDEVARILIDARANMYHAVDSKDIGLMERMLERGIDVDSRGRRGKTALHVAATGDDAVSAEWLINHGADVNSVTEHGESPLLLAASSRSKDTLKILLERGANPNLKSRSDSSPLYALFQNKRCEFNEKDVECVELLLQYGAIPQNSVIIRGTIFEHALDRSSEQAVRMLVSHLAMLEMRGVSITKSVMRCEDVKYRWKMSKLEQFRERCLRVLKNTVFGKFSLSDLLNVSQKKLQVMVRNEEFFSKVRKVCKLGELNPYYCKQMMERIDEASRVVILKNESIRVVCRLFDGNYDECYIFARRVVDYLDVADLEQLLEIVKFL